MKMENRPEIKIEILRAEDIKEEIRTVHNLPEFGIVIKSSTRTSPSADTYEFMLSPFLERLNKSITSFSPRLLSLFKGLK
ncbi:hypothetical protein HYV84_05945 [Candidatus Woesearchaeota archaeon]|nr:hypothetical protein [Candidatus Woesearchaeota archaeon]